MSIDSWEYMCIMCNNMPCKASLDTEVLFPPPPSSPSPSLSSNYRMVIQHVSLYPTFYTVNIQHPYQGVGGLISYCHKVLSYRSNIVYTLTLVHM